MYPRVSYSSLERFEACSMRHFLHVNRQRSPMGPEYVLVGNAMHYGLAAYIDTHGWVSVIDAAVWEFERRLREEKPRWDRAHLQEMYDKVRIGADRLQEMLAKRWGWEQMRSEVRLFRAFRGWSIEGYLDMTIGVGEEIWDLKTGGWHADQLVFYDVLTEAVIGTQPKKVGIIEVFGRGFIETPVTDADRLAMKERIKRFVQRVASGDWEFEGYSSECHRCRCKAYCPKWDAARSGSLGA